MRGKEGYEIQRVEYVEYAEVGAVSRVHLVRVVYHLAACGIGIFRQRHPLKRHGTAGDVLRQGFQLSTLPYSTPWFSIHLIFNSS